tara:strand:+ start:317 stop:634 length:318 start_codon:yes stop_codon:yes gene_type:complete
MVIERLNSSYIDTLLSNEHASLQEDIVHLDLSCTSNNSLSFDDRIDVFKSLTQSLLFQRTAILSDDIEFWFPECAPSYKRDIKLAVSKEKIDASLECVIAEFMEA